MARGGSRSKRRRLGRDNSYITRDKRSLPLAYLRVRGPLRLYEDRRRYDPEGRERSLRRFDGQRPRVSIARNPKVRPTRINHRRERLPGVWSQLPAGVRFENPEQVLVCARRKIRREVLHALRKSGKRGQKRPRITWKSKVHCK